MQSTLRLLWLTVAAVLISFVSALAQTSPTVYTDKPDYHPGDTLVITGSGWQPGETVKLHLDEYPKLCITDHNLYAVADSNGDIYNKEFVFRQSHLGITFILTATGQSSALTAEAIFTDANFTSTGNGDWNKGATWGNPGNDVEGSGYPGPNDVVSIGSGHSITLTANHSCASLAIAAGTANPSTSQLTTQSFTLCEFAKVFGQEVISKKL